FGDHLTPTLEPLLLRLEPGEKYTANVHLFATVPHTLLLPGTYSICLCTRTTASGSFPSRCRSLPGARCSPPLVFRFRGLPGPAFRVLSAAGPIFLLTSEALHGLVGLAERYLRAQPILQQTQVRQVPLQGVEVNSALNKYLLVVLADAVAAIEIDSL